MVELNQLAYRYAAAVDACDVAGFLAVFTPDARLRSYYPDEERPFADLVEHEQLAAIPNTMRSMFRHTTHMMTNHLIEFDGEQASGSLLCTARHLRIDPAEPTALTVIISYLDRYVKQAGAWWIADREIRFLWSEKHEVVESGFAGRNE